jgi:hypothetical protein
MARTFPPMSGTRAVARNSPKVPGFQLNCTADDGQPLAASSVGDDAKYPNKSHASPNEGCRSRDPVLGLLATRNKPANTTVHFSRRKEHY